MKSKQLITKFPEAYSIVHKKTKELWKAGSKKTVWAKPGHAKNAWSVHSISLWQNENESYEDFVARVAIQEKYYGVKFIFEKCNYLRGEWRATFPKFDEQDQYEIVKLETVTSKVVDLLRECEAYVPIELKNRIREALDKQ